MQQGNKLKVGQASVKNCTQAKGSEVRSLAHCGSSPQLNSSKSLQVTFESTKKYKEQIGKRRLGSVNLPHEKKAQKPVLSV